MIYAQLYGCDNLGCAACQPHVIEWHLYADKLFLFLFCSENVDFLERSFNPPTDTQLQGYWADLS